MVQVEDVLVPFVAAGMGGNALQSVVDLHPIPVGVQRQVLVGVPGGHGVAAGLEGYQGRAGAAHGQRAAAVKAVARQWSQQALLLVPLLLDGVWLAPQGALGVVQAALPQDGVKLFP